MAANRGMYTKSNYTRSSQAGKWRLFRSPTVEMVEATAAETPSRGRAKLAAFRYVAGSGWRSRLRRPPPVSTSARCIGSRNRDRLKSVQSLDFSGVATFLT
jgi:hypothetical protein